MENYERDRTLEDVHRDVAFANTYRLEYIKHLMSIAAGIFVISIAFIKDFVGDYDKAVFKSGLVSGWAFLILSIVAGIFHMKCWDRFYISYRKNFEEGLKRRKVINKYRTIAEFCQITFFILAIVMIFAFSVVNLFR